MNAEKDTAFFNLEQETNIKPKGKDDKQEKVAFQEFLVSQLKFAQEKNQNKLESQNL